MSYIHYCPSCGTEMKAHKLICPKCGKCCELFEMGIDTEEKPQKPKTDHKTIVTQTGAILDAAQIERNLQWTKYRTRSAQGFAAEDANAFNERLRGMKVEQVGRSNTLNGADRITNGQWIQTKYYQTAKGSVDAAFEGAGGNYKYVDNNGGPQILEVPKDQYEDAIRRLEERIEHGDMKNVGIDDPQKAKDIIKKGDYTYKQAKNIAKAGNIDSLLFDIKTGSVIALGTMGISFTINLGITIIFNKKNGLSFSDAVKMSLLAGLQSGCVTLGSHVAYMQLIRTSVGRKFAALTTKGAKYAVDNIWKTDFGKKVITKLAKSLIKKNVTGAAAKNVLIKNIRTDVITQTILFVITSIPDTVSLIKGKVSNQQYIKNLCVGGATATGATIGMWLGGIATSNQGGWGIPIGGLVGGFVFEQGAQWVGNQLHEDDAIKMSRLVLLAKIRLSNEYLLQSQEEFDYVDANLVHYKVIDPEFLVAMYAVGGPEGDDFKRVDYACARMEYYFEKAIRKRKTVIVSKAEGLIDSCITELSEEIEQMSLDENDLD